MSLQQNSGVTFVWRKPVRHANHIVLKLPLLAHRKAPFFLTKGKAFFIGLQYKLRMYVAMLAEVFVYYKQILLLRYSIYEL
jgi:hypothetical protein